MSYRYATLFFLALALPGCGPGGQGARIPLSATVDDGHPVGASPGSQATRTHGNQAVPLEPNVPFAMLGGGPMHHHRTAVPGPKSAPVETARFHCGGRIASAPVIGPDGTIYIGAVDGTFNALGRDGKLRWTYICDAPIFSTAAVSQAGKVFVGCDEDSLLAFSTDGTLRWTYKMKQDVDSSPVISDDGVIFVGGSGLHALDGDGRKRFKLWLGGHVTASPAVRPDGAIAVGSHDHRFYIVAPDGTVISVFDTKGPIHGAAAVLTSNDMIFGSDDGDVYRLAKGGGMRWKLKTDGPVRAGIAVTEDEKRIFTASLDGAIYAADAETGKIVWKTETGRGVMATPMLDSDGMIYVGSRDRHLYALASATGEIVWRLDLGFEIDATVAVPGEGRLIAADDSGAIHLFEEKK